MIRAALLVLAAILAAAPPAEALSGGQVPLRIVTFGTSLTARGGWQAPLQAALQSCLARPVDVRTVALSGSTSEWARMQIETVVDHRPDIVLVEFSANDAAIDRFLWLSESRENMTAVFNGLRHKLPETKIYSMAMNPIIGRRGWVRPFLADYIDAHRELAAERGIGFIDFRPRWSALSDDDLSAAIPDGSHPKPEVAAAMIVPELVARLGGDCAAAGRPAAGESDTTQVPTGVRAP